MVKHTPGKWSTSWDKEDDRCTVYSVPQDVNVAILFKTVDDIEANARLIAASPTMYSDHDANHRDAIRALDALGEGDTATVRRELEWIVERSAGSIDEAIGPTEGGDP